MSVDTSTVRAEIAHRAELPQGPKGVLDLIDRNEVELSKLLGPDLTVEAFKTATMTYLRQNPNLYSCDPYSVVGGLRQGAQLGFQLGPLGHFYLVPYKQEAVFIIGYRGFVELAYRAGVKSIEARLVYEGQHFRALGGTTPKIEHDLADPGDDAAVVAAYAVAKTASGGTVSEVIYERQWEKARQASAIGRRGEGPWKDHRPAMIRKTALRRLAPWLPSTPVFQAALESDETRQPAMLDTDEQPTEIEADDE